MSEISKSEFHENCWFIITFGWHNWMRAVSSIHVCLPSFIFKKLNFLRFHLPPALWPPWNVLSRHVWTWKTNSPHSPSARFTRGPRGMVSTTPINRIAQSQLLLLKCELNLCDYIIMLWHRCIINLNHSNKINFSITNNVANAHTTAKLIAQCFDWRNVISEVR